jgi:nitroreductase
VLRACSGKRFPPGSIHIGRETGGSPEVDATGPQALCCRKTQNVWLHGMSREGGQGMFIDLLRRRRSIRNFDSRTIEPEKMDLLIEAMLRSPTSKGRRPWEFIIVTDPEIRAALAAAKPKGASFLGGAPVCIVICGNPDTSDVWIEDCAVAATMLQLAAEDVGLGSCWSQIRGRQHATGISATSALRQLLQLPDNFQIASIIGIGYPSASVLPNPEEALPVQKIHENHYNHRR